MNLKQIKSEAMKEKKSRAGAKVFKQGFRTGYVVAIELALAEIGGDIKELPNAGHTAVGGAMYAFNKAINAERYRTRTALIELKKSI